MAAVFGVIFTGTVLLFAWTSSSSIDSNSDNRILRLKMDVLEQKIMEIKMDVMQNQHRLEHALEKISKMIASRDEQDPIIFPDRLALIMENPYNNSDDRLAMAMLQNNDGQPFETCSELQEHDAPSGKYLLMLPGTRRVFDAHCDQNTSHGGWLVIQNRIDGSESFEKNWNWYKKGFGEGDKNYWIGLSTLHRLTANRSYELRVELEDTSGNKKYAEYSQFEVGSPSEFYKLKKLGAYKGTAGDALKYLVGAGFSTFDNDHSTTNCAANAKGGWWLKSCTSSHYSNLNGVYGGPDKQSIMWYFFSSRYTGLKSSRMMIRPNVR